MKELERHLIEQIRRQKQITAKELSERLGISQRSVKNYVKEALIKSPVKDVCKRKWR